MKSVTLLLLACLASGSIAMMDAKMKGKVDTWNLYSTCFGSELASAYYMGILKSCHYCMNIAPPTDLFNEVDNLSDNEVEVLKGLLSNPALAQLLMASSNLRRNKREIGAPISSEKLNMLKDNIAHHKMEMMTKIGNLTCVLTQMKFLTADGDINMDAFSYNTMEKLFGGSNAAGGDDDFLKALATGYSDCYDISRSWPQSSLDRHPLMKAYGRQKVFLHCIFKTETKMCYKWQLYEGMRKFHGLDTGDVDLGIPGNKFEAAAGAWMVGYETAPKEMQFVDDFFWARHD